MRQYFPKGTDLSRWSAEDIDAVAAMLNSRPRKTLGWKTPAEAFDEQLLLAPARPVLLRSIEPSQFTSWAFTENIRRLGLLSSMGTVGDCYDNAPMESFWGSMQIELLNRQKWRTILELAIAMADYIERFYNSTADTARSAISPRTNSKTYTQPPPNRPLCPKSGPLNGVNPTGERGRPGAGRAKTAVPGAPAPPETGRAGRRGATVTTSWNHYWSSPRIQHFLALTHHDPRRSSAPT